MLKICKILEKEQDDFENILCVSIIKEYTQQQKSLENLSLVEYTAFYSSNYRKLHKRETPKIICYVRYYPHIDPKKYCREKIMLYVPFRSGEQSLITRYGTWSAKFNEKKVQVANIKKMFTMKTISKWGDIDEGYKKDEIDNILAINIANEFDRDK